MLITVHQDKIIDVVRDLLKEFQKFHENGKTSEKVSLMVNEKRQSLEYVIGEKQ